MMTKEFNYAMKINAVRINRWDLHEHHLSIEYSADQFTFSTKVFYHDVSFSSLMCRYSKLLIHQIAAHIVLFEGMKLCSLFPKSYDITTVVDYLSADALDLFSQVYAGVFAQHLYENQRNDYEGPQICFSEGRLGSSQPQELLGENRTILAACGGGKDSILAMKILEEAEIPFASMQYAHSVYGQAEVQHNLIEEVLNLVTPRNQHKITIHDDFIGYPFLSLYFPDQSGITIPETPVSVFESLFIALNYGYSHLTLAHERSANQGNLYWAELGQYVNHQWGKGFDAEKLISRYIKENLLSNFNYFSILQPIYDFRIFTNLTRYPEVLSKIHSCNQQKPWCKKCAKCAYVWLGLMAVFPTEQIDAIFQKNFFDDPDLLPIYRQMIGLAEHTPFECIGEINESRLSMKKCIEKGLTGQVLNLFQQEILTDSSISWSEIEMKYTNVYEHDHSIPGWIFERIIRYL